MAALHGIQFECLEILLRMALLAVGSAVAVVDIVAVMAIDTAVGGLLPGHLVEGAMVAAMAVGFPMNAAQLEVGAVMVEVPDQPVVGTMAPLAVLTQCLLMDVIGLVATVAVGFGILEARCQVAGLAGGNSVQADQREGGQVVIKANILHPP